MAEAVKPSAVWLEISSPEFPACRIGHRPIQRALAGRAIRITAAPYTREHLESLSLVYQTVGAATGREIPMSRRETEAYYEADIRAEDVVDGTLAYRILARTETQEISVPEAPWQIIRVTSDGAPPLIEPMQLVGFRQPDRFGTEHLHQFPRGRLVAMGTVVTVHVDDVEVVR